MIVCLLRSSHDAGKSFLFVVNTVHRTFLNPQGDASLSSSRSIKNLRRCNSTTQVNQQTNVSLRYKHGPCGRNKPGTGDARNASVCRTLPSLLITDTDPLSCTVCAGCILQSLRQNLGLALTSSVGSSDDLYSDTCVTNIKDVFLETTEKNVCFSDKVCQAVFKPEPLSQQQLAAPNASAARTMAIVARQLRQEKEWRGAGRLLLWSRGAGTCFVPG